MRVQPQPFGLYTLIHRINVGGMAEVFKACYYDNEQPAFAAIKRILPHLAQDRSFIDMFITEAHTAGRLVHPNIAQIIEQGEEEGEYYISMEYVSGRDLLYLRHHLRERGMFFPPALAAFVIMNVASALDYAHRLCDHNGQHLEIIHRDVSPQNILISYDGEVKLIDFGIAKAKVRTQEHTRAGVLKGKFGYMAPEQVKGLPIDHRTDIFALGTVFYELLTNQRLFMGDSDIETLEMVREARVIPPSSINEWIPPQLDQIILLALQPDPQHRFQSAGDFAQALHYYLQQEAPMTHHNTLKTWMSQEFSTFIAHEKAQDAYLMEQMYQNIADQQEDMDSTSLISADAIEMLNQYTSQQLQAQVEVDHEDPTGPLSQHASWSQANEHTASDTTPPSNLSDEHEQPATRQVSADMFQGLNQPLYPKAHTPYASPADLKRDESLDEQHLEELFEESFDDHDESEVSVIEENLDQILAHSLSQGQASPLQTPSAQSLLNAKSSPFAQSSESSSPLVSQSPASFHSSTAKTPHIHDEPTPPPASINDRMTTPLNEPVRSAPAFSAHEPTPIPQRSPFISDRVAIQRSQQKQSKKGLVKALVAVVLLAVIGGGAWFVLQGPTATPIQVTIDPFQDTSVQIGIQAPIPGQAQQNLALSDGQKLVVRHPELPTWERVIKLDDLTQSLKIDLEAQAEHHQVNLRSNSANTELWVLGKLRGKLPYKGKLPLNHRGEINLTFKAPGKSELSKTVKPKSKTKAIFYYARF